MWFGIVTLFPEMFAPLTKGGIVARAKHEKCVDWAFVNPRDLTTDPHRTVDDRPYGGGPGMVLKPEPLALATRVARLRAPESPMVIALSPSGKPLTQALVQVLAQKKALVLVCGRYEGIDQRYLDTEVDLEVSIGDYVLSGGEIPAMVLIDAITRLQSGALSHPLSAEQDSFSGQELMLDWPHYTRPENYKGNKVPDVLLSGDHKAIERWRQEQAKLRTQQCRPDLMARNHETSDCATFEN